MISAAAAASIPRIVNIPGRNARSRVDWLRHSWTFDDTFSVFATQGLESKKRGVFTRKELAPLAEVNVTSLKYDRAIADYNEAIRLDPKNAPALSNRGNAYYAKQDYDRAIVDYSEAVRLDPRYIRAYGNRAGAYYVRRDYRRAIADFTEVIRLEPDNAAAYAGRGNAYNAVGEVDRADADFRQAKRLEK